MHLKSITMKGFKSFPDRTRLEFGPGISVVVGPNGSGKSNVTDAVLWAMGEQSPLAVRGQSMQDVIFGGGRGVQARGAAEVELVIDNSDGALDLPMSEISILRSLDRSGEGEYRLNGARCRLVDVIETLSDTGLGKEMHSVISQGRVEAIVTSKARDRRLLIEEAAGLGKHRKRRRRAQLKLERTQDNLDRALDVEREARSRLRPLKRQAEAAELHERLELQVLQTRWELSRDDLRARRAELEQSEGAAREARAALGEMERELAEVAVRREAAERALAERSERRDHLASRAYSARSAAERTELRSEQARAAADGLLERAAAREAELESLLAGDGAVDESDRGLEERVAALEAELAGLATERERELEGELASLGAERERAAVRVTELESDAALRRAEVRRAEEAADATRVSLRAAERDVEAARSRAAAVGAELAAVNQFLRAHANAAGGTRALSGELEVQPGCELALAAALGGRLVAAIVDDASAGARMLDGAGVDGGRALVAGASEAPPLRAPGSPPSPDATRLLDLVSGPEPALALARRLLADAWLVADVERVAPSFAGIAVTRSGRAWFGASGELRQVAEGGAERLLAQRNRREVLLADMDRAVGAEHTAGAAAAEAAEAMRAAESAREQAESALREADREHSRAQEAHRRSVWLIEQRREAPDQGASAVRRAQLEGELAAERRSLERVERERLARTARTAMLEKQVVRDRELEGAARRLVAALEAIGAAGEAVVAELDQALSGDRQEGEALAVELRGCATREAEIQARLRAQGEDVTGAEVRAAQARDRHSEVDAELAELAQRLGLGAEPATEALDEEQRVSLAGRHERLERRREQLGPVNPLAQQEHSEALEHVEALEEQRTDLESALRELRTLIRDTDRQIRETFEETFAAAARNFEQLVGDVFPGGRGRLRLVSEDAGPRTVLGGQAVAGGADGSAGAGASADIDPEAEAEAEAAAQADAEGLAPDELLGVEIEVTPAGKNMKRLSLLSGGEKSMTAIAFLFAVFLARPCPFYILDEVEAALDDLNIDRFLNLLRRHSDRAQFIVVTHQKRTMEAADCLYGVSMGDDGVSKVISRRLPPEVAAEAGAAA